MPEPRHAAGQQEHHGEWVDQWTRYREDDSSIWLFHDWIKPATLEDFRNKDVLECGCGPGHHTEVAAPVARSVTAVDLNTVEIAKTHAARFPNVTFVTADLATMELGRQFDVVFCIGVIHHTDNPTRTFGNIFRHLKPGGTMIVWTYSAEGNAMVRFGVEPIRRLILRHLPRGVVNALSWVIAGLLWPIVHTVYRLPGTGGLPYHDYFANARTLGFKRTVLNVYDKLNAPQTRFTTRATAEAWMSPERFETVSILPYCGVSWSLVGRKRAGL